MIKKFEEYIRELRGQEIVNLEIPRLYEDNNKDVAGLKEVIEVEGLGKMKVKLDSGNTAMNALIVQDYFEDKDKRTVKFDFNGEEKTFDVVKHIRIWHHGKSTERPVIKVNIKFNGKEYKDEFIDLKVSDLTGTKNYRCRMLLCKDFMAKAKIVIDPSKEFKLTDKKDLPKKKKKKINESIWADVRKKSLGKEEREENKVPLEFQTILEWKEKLKENLEKYQYDKYFKEPELLNNGDLCQRFEDELYMTPYEEWNKKYESSYTYIPILYFRENDVFNFKLLKIYWEDDCVFDHCELYSFFLGVNFEYCADRNSTIHLKFWPYFKEDGKITQGDFGELVYDINDDKWYFEGNYFDVGEYTPGMVDDNFERFLYLIASTVNPESRYNV